MQDVKTFKLCTQKLNVSLPGFFPVQATLTNVLAMAEGGLHAPTLRYVVSVFTNPVKYDLIRAKVV